MINSTKITQLIDVGKRHFYFVSLKQKTPKNQNQPVLFTATHKPHSDGVGSDLGSTGLLKMYFKWQ